MRRIFLRLLAHSTAVADVELLLKTMGDSPAKISRAEGVIELPMGQLLKVIDSTDPESWKAQEDDLADWKIVKKLAGEEHYLVYSAHKTPYPISHRELLYVRSRHVLEDGRVMIVGSSVNDKEQPVQESRVRAAVLACWVMKAIDANKTNVIRMIQLDPKGNIPSFLVNTHNAKTAKALGVITEAAKK